MKPILWIILAIASTLLAGATVVPLVGHSIEAKDLATASDGTPEAQQEIDYQANLTHRWTYLAATAEILSLALWIAFARAWNRTAANPHPWLRYTLALFLAIAAPCAVMAVVIILL